MADAKVGDIKYFHESGDIFKVEVLDVQKKAYGKTPGEEYHKNPPGGFLGCQKCYDIFVHGLRILEVVDTKEGAAAPVSGLEFSVWSAENAGGYAGWHLLDHP